MRTQYSISETCNCGARFIYNEDIAHTYESKLDTEHTRFLNSHSSCRENKPIVIADNKQLKAFLINKINIDSMKATIKE